MNRLKIFICLVTISIVFIAHVNKMFSKNFEKKLKQNEKYIQFECKYEDVCGGWADRLKAIMSTYAFSLVTERKFLLKMSKNCDLKAILEPNEINWDYKQFNLTNFTKVTLNLGKHASQVFKTAKSDLLSQYSNKNLIVIKSQYMFSKTLTENPHLKVKIEKMGYDKNKFNLAFQFKNWYEKLFRLNQNHRLRYEFLLKKLKPDKNYNLICAQIRIGDHGHRGESDPRISQDFWSFIYTKFLSYKKKSIKYSIFVTSDREYVKTEAKKYFKNYKVVFTNNSSIHIDKLKRKENCRLWQNVIFDFHFMQNCDIGIVSHSGFGILSMWNRINPFKDLYVYTKKDQTQLKRNYWLRNNLTFLRYANLNDIYFP